MTLFVRTSNSHSVASLVLLLDMFLLHAFLAHSDPDSTSGWGASRAEARSSMDLSQRHRPDKIQITVVSPTTSPEVIARCVIAFRN